jgi:hypothetical protein
MKGLRMARQIGVEDGDTVYRAALSFTNARGESWDKMEGPYPKLGTARGRISFWKKHMANSGGSATGHPEQGHVLWGSVGEKPKLIPALDDGEQHMFAVALAAAQEKLWSEDGWTSRDQDSLDSLRRLLDKTQGNP